MVTLNFQLSTLNFQLSITPFSRDFCFAQHSISELDSAFACRKNSQFSILNSQLYLRATASALWMRQLKLLVAS